jgi:DNA processing protein
MRRAPLSEVERLDWLRLARTSGVGPVTFSKLIERFGSAEAAIDALPRLSKRGGRTTPLKPASYDRAMRELDRLDQLSARLLCACEPDFPDLLAATDPPPPVISVKGPLDPDARPVCALVGARNASAIGLRFAGDLAQTLGERGVVVASGLARGIDGAAHAAALESGTIAVTAGGLASVYPPEHERLHAAIGEQGLLISESPPDYTPQARDFPRRNRLISGLSLGVVVIEAAERSGSLITARYALEQGREVMAAPGSPLDPRAKGANRLLREGAALIETAEDVIAVLEQTRRPSVKAPSGSEFEDEAIKPEQLDAEAESVRERVAGLLSPSPVSRDDLVRASGAPARAVIAALVELELAGRAIVNADGSVSAGFPDESV